MTIKERVLAAAKTSYAKYGLKGRELEKLADVIVASKGLTDDSTDDDVNSAITGATSYVEIMQSVGNRYANDVEKKYEGYVKPNEPPVEPPKPNEPPIIDPNKPMTLADVQKLLEEQKKNLDEANKTALEAALAPFKQKEEAARLRTLLDGHEKLKDIPQKFRNLYSLDKDENLDAKAEEIAADYQAMKAEMFKSGTIVEAPKAASEGDENDEVISMLKKVNETPSTTTQNK